MKRIFISFVMTLLILSVGCTEDNPVKPLESFKLTISIEDSAGVPMEDVDIKRKNFLNDCVLEYVNNSRRIVESDEQYTDYCIMTKIGNLNTSGNSLLIYDVLDEPEPVEYNVGPIYPSPFNPATAICFSLKDSCNVSMDMLDWRGEIVNKLIRQHSKAGQYKKIWYACDDYGSALIDGVYTCRLIAKNIHTGVDVFCGKANVTLYKSLDICQCNVIGQTNSSGVFETSDLDLFPCIQGHSPQVCLDQTADTVGTCLFVDSVRIYMTTTDYVTIAELDSIERVIGFSRKIKLANGVNNYTFIWDPDTTYNIP